MENNNSSSNFTDKISDKVNDLVYKYYKESYINDFSNMGITKSFLNNSTFLNLNGFFKNNIVIISMIIGGIFVISGLIYILTPLSIAPAIFTSFSNPLYLLNILFDVIGGATLAIITFISGVGLIKMKKWVPFITIILFWVSNIFNIISNLLNFSTPYSYASIYNTTFSRGIVGIIIGIAFSIFFSLLFTSLIIKNKDSFSD